MHSAIIRFATLFFGCLATFSAFAAATGLQNRLGPIERVIALGATVLASFAGVESEIIEGNLIRVGSASLEVNHECTGLFLFVILFSFILAYPTAWRYKVAGMAIGLTLLSMVNLTRIAVLVWLADAYPELFQYFHEYIWQGVFLMLVTLFAMAWVERSRQ